jgi:hypothetical protein
MSLQLLDLCHKTSNFTYLPSRYLALLLPSPNFDTLNLINQVRGNKAIVFPPGGIINLNDDSSSCKRSVGSNVEEVVQWDHDLRQTKTFMTTFKLLVLHCRYDAPELEEQQKLLKYFIDEPV